MKVRIIAVGDVHGCAGEFEELLGKLALTRHDRLILLGDLVNRGPDSARVIALAREHAHRALLGNHGSLGIDTSCVQGGALTACILPGRTLVQVPARERYFDS